MVLFSQLSHKIIEVRKRPPKHVTFDVNSSKMNKQSLLNFESDKTVEKGSFIKRQTSSKLSDNEWYDEWQRVTTSDSE